LLIRPRKFPPTAATKTRRIDSGIHETAVPPRRFAIGFSQPLLPVRSRGEKPLAPPLFKLSSEDVIVNTLKPSDDGKAWIIRLFGAAGREAAVNLSWAAPRQFWLSDTGEQPLPKLDGCVTVPGGGLVTLRAQ
jgi:alpha-mannosidase